MSVNKHAVLKAWVEGFLSGAKMSFENIEIYQGFRSVVPDYGDFIIKTDVIGRKYKQYTFGFVAIEPLDRYDTGTNNTGTMYLVEQFNEWLVTQEKNKSYPNFGTNVVKYKIVPLQNMPNLAQVDEETGMAKYVLMARIEYVEKE